MIIANKVVFFSELGLVVALLAVGALLFIKGRDIKAGAKGLRLVFAGVLVDIWAASLDVIEEVSFAQKVLGMNEPGGNETLIMLFGFAPGTILIGLGVAAWLPALRQLDGEIARREQNERALRAARDKAEGANEAKSTFLATMSHELRTPLNGIIGYGHLMEESAGAMTAEDQRQYAQIIQQSGEHLLSLINDILDLSKVESGRLEVHCEPVDFASITELCVAYVAPTAKGKEVAITNTVALESLRTDRRLVKQILINLLSNAVKFTEPGGGVQLEAVAEDGGVVIKVTDTGIGMTAAEIDRALEPFVQIERGGEGAHKGTGLGLPLVIRFVDLLQGRFTIASVKGEGTTVTIWLPGQPDAVPLSPAASAVSPSR